MSIARRVLAQSPEPEAHDKVLDNNSDRIGIWKFWFLGRGENRSTRKTSRSKDENQQQTQPTYDAESGNRTRATLVGGDCSHHCANSTPLFLKFMLQVIIIGWLRCQETVKKNRPPHKHKVLTVMYPCSRAAKETIILKNTLLGFPQL